jgi:multiple sugar transport system ATP-binding protein
MGDRIVVMLDGQVRQVGPPQAVYERPADTFVATFLGSPPMNLVPRDGAIVGFRPEKALPAEVLGGGHEGHLCWTLDVHRIEYLSGDRHLHGLATRLGEPAPVIVRLPATVLTPIEAGTTHEFVVREEDLCWFDPKTQKATDGRAG